MGKIVENDSEDQDSENERKPQKSQKGKSTPSTTEEKTGEDEEAPSTKTPAKTGEEVPSTKTPAKTVVVKNPTTPAETKTLIATTKTKTAPSSKVKTPAPKGEKLEEKILSPTTKKTPAKAKTSATEDETSTPLPAKTKTPTLTHDEDVTMDDVTPAPTATKTPVKAKSPAPQKTTPAPTTSKVETPAPTKVETPAPKKVETPAPRKVATPAPTKVETPAPTKPETPAPNGVSFSDDEMTFSDDETPKPTTTIPGNSFLADEITSSADDESPTPTNTKSPTTPNTKTPAQAYPTNSGASRKRKTPQGETTKTDQGKPFFMNDLHYAVFYPRIIREIYRAATILPYTIIDGHAYVLLGLELRQRKHHGWFWSPCGGKREEGEDIEDTCTREFNEETGGFFDHLLPQIRENLHKESTYKFYISSGKDCLLFTPISFDPSIPTKFKNWITELVDIVNSPTSSEESKNEASTKLNKTGKRQLLWVNAKKLTGGRRVRSDIGEDFDLQLYPYFCQTLRLPPIKLLLSVLHTSPSLCELMTMLEKEQNPINTGFYIMTDPKFPAGTQLWSGVQILPPDLEISKSGSNKRSLQTSQSGDSGGGEAEEVGEEGKEEGKVEGKKEEKGNEGIQEASKGGESEGKELAKQKKKIARKARSVRIAKKKLKKIAQRKEAEEKNKNK